MNEKRKLFEKLYSNIHEDDSEYSSIIENFIDNEVLAQIELTDKEIMLVVVSTLIANQSKDLYQLLLADIMEVLTPVELKEIIYQSTIYVGLSKSYEFLDVTNDFFKAEGITLPLESQKSIEYEDRLERGYNLQARNFSKEFIDKSIENTPDNQKYIWNMISSFAYGDFYTRGGLDDRQRELISFAFVLSLRGCENQLRIHTIGNIKVGNNKKKLIDTVTMLIAFIGFPRMHNALAVINEIED